MKTGDSLIELHDFLRAHFRQFELILVDDGLTEEIQSQLLAILDRRENIRYVRLARHYSLEIATTCALEQTIGDVAVLFNLDTDLPESILPLAREASKGSIAIAREQRHQGMLRQFLARIFHRLLRRIGGVKFDLQEGAERAYPRAALTALNKIRNRRRNIRLFHSYIGIPQVLMDVPRRENHRRESLFQLSNRGLDLLFSNFIHPLKWVSWLGCATALLNMCYLGYVFAVALIKRNVAPGWVSYSASTTVMFLVLFLILAVVAEYVGRIQEEVQERPLYFIDFEKDSRIDLKDRIINVV
ncbi:MAG: glycosyltransferase [Puniceicoccales bacterium]|nr:glycosyltransferase [Puniceicoccales bacterium]